MFPNNRYLPITNYLAIKLLNYLQFQHLQTLPYWKLLVISFCYSLASTLLLIEGTMIDLLYLWVIMDTLSPLVAMHLLVRSCVIVGFFLNYYVPQQNSSTFSTPCWIKKARDVIMLNVCRTRRCRTFGTWIGWNVKTFDYINHVIKRFHFRSMMVRGHTLPSHCYASPS